MSEKTPSIKTTQLKINSIIAGLRSGELVPGIPTTGNFAGRLAFFKRELPAGVESTPTERAIEILETALAGLAIEAVL